MNRNNRFCFRSDFLYYFSRINIHGILIAINKNRDSAGMNHRVCSCRKSHRRHKHFVASFNADHLHRQMQRSGARIQGYRKSGSLIRPKIFFKFFYFWTCPQPTTFQTINNLVYFRLFNQGISKYQEIFSHIFSPYRAIKILLIIKPLKKHICFFLTI